MLEWTVIGGNKLEICWNRLKLAIIVRNELEGTFIGWNWVKLAGLGCTMLE